jgi:hypothetical protein
MEWRLTAADLGRPIRVVFFGGAFLEPAAVEFVARLHEHPEIDLVGGFCQSRGFGVRHRVADVCRRRGLLAPPLLVLDGVQHAIRWLRRPYAGRAWRRRAREAVRRLVPVPDIHAPTVLDQVRQLAPDLGVAYGAPLLQPSLFEIPTRGTLSIHHGRLPQYRGKKTAFWAMVNGEPAAGVTIQRIDAGLDTGAIVCAGDVPIRGRRYGRVHDDVQALGLTLYMSAVLAVKRGQGRAVPQPPGRFPVYRQPGARDILRFWCRQLLPGRR